MTLRNVAEGCTERPTCKVELKNHGDIAAEQPIEFCEPTQYGGWLTLTTADGREMAEVRFEAGESAGSVAERLLDELRRRNARSSVD